MMGVPAQCLVGICVLAMAVAPPVLYAEEEKAKSSTQPDRSKEAAKPALDPQQEAQVRVLQSVLKVELSFLNRVADLSDEQLAEAIAVGKSQVEEEVRKAPKNNGRHIQFFGGGLVQRSPDLRDTLETALQLRFQRLLDDDQQHKYASELEMRAKFEKQAVVDSLVSALDSRLNLSNEQRSQITEKLMQVPDENLPQIGRALNFGRYLPAMDDREILPCLNEDQRRIFRGIQRVTFSTSNNLESTTPFIVDDIDLDQ